MELSHDFVLLDRSSSMSNLWTEALSAVNNYVKKLADDKVDTGVTLVTFDTDNGIFQFDVIRDRIIPSTWKPVTNTDAIPRGMTPLNDAIGRIVGLAKAGNYDKLALIIMTDGDENASREVSFHEAKKLLDDCRAKGWQVIFLGANYDNAAQAESYGTRSTQHLRSSTRNLGVVGQSIGQMRSDYSRGVAATMEFTDDDKEEFAKP